MSNALVRAVLQGRFDAALIEPAMTDLMSLVDIRPVGASTAALRASALAEGISFFDAHYLELALAERLTLASRDGGLLAAAQRAGVTIEDWR